MKRKKMKALEKGQKHCDSHLRRRAIKRWILNLNFTEMFLLTPYPLQQSSSLITVDYI